MPRCITGRLLLLGNNSSSARDHRRTASFYVAKFVSRHSGVLISRWPRRSDPLSLPPHMQRMPQRHRPHQGARVGRGRRHQVEGEAAFQTRIRRLPGPDHHRGPHAQRRDGRLVQSWYVCRKHNREAELTRRFLGLYSCREFDKCFM